MRSFSELLREYTGRTGVSDAELARAVGVQRQTVFRWKEGLVARPRSAEDVERLAAKLRLTSAERDELLLAAGFPPTTPNIPPAPAREAQLEPEVLDLLPATNAPYPDRNVPDRAPAARSKLRRRQLLLWTAAGACLFLLTAIVLLAVQRHRSAYPQAGPGETLVVIAQFGNYTGGAQGYNVAGRLREALERELAAAGLKDARAAVWPAEVADEPAAREALGQSGAALLIWGEYDSGRVVAHLLPQSDLPAAPGDVALLAATPSDLPAVINSTLPGDIRYLALYSLAQIYLRDGQPALARAALGQAGLELPEDPGTRAAHYFFLGYANQVGQPPDIDAAIEGYTDALKLDGELDAARNNRAIAYLRRRGPGDLVGAVGDLTRYLAKHADDPAALNNRGSAYFLMGGPDNVKRAIVDFDKAIELAPQDPTGYYNRGLAYVRLDQGEKWRADLQRALEGGHSGANAGLCWAYSLSEEPAKAIDYCREAARAGGDPGPWENLGVAYARTGRFSEAAAALTTYRDALRAKNNGQPSAEETQVGEWLAVVNVGKNPFDAAALRALREE